MNSETGTLFVNINDAVHLKTEREKLAIGMIMILTLLQTY
jgi:hypothetical protein